MDEIVKIVMSKSGLPEDKSRLAIKAVIEFLKQRLPEPLGTQVESILTGAVTKDLSQSLQDLIK